MSHVVYSGITRSGLMCAGIERTMGSIGPAFIGSIATKQAVRLAEFDRRLRFQGWLGHVDSRRPLQLEQHEMDVVKITRARDSNDNSMKDEAHIEMHVPIQLPRPTVYPRRSTHDCGHCGAPGISVATHHCYFCGMHFSCSSCRPDSKGHCIDAEFPDVGKFRGKYGSERWLLQPAVPTANEIRAHLGLELLTDERVEAQAPDQSHARNVPSDAEARAEAATATAAAGADSSTAAEAVKGKRA